MNKFKPGDYIVPVRVMRTDDAVVQELGNQVGKVLQVLTVFQGIGLSVFAGKPKSEAWSWHPAELRLATTEEIEAATKPKPLASKRRVEMPNSFTPGPWAIYFNSQDDFVIRKMFADGQESHVVARCHSGAANASLIASAPDLLRQRDELLEALIGLLGEAEAIAQVLPAYGESTNLKNARAVINKIGGDA